METIFITGFSGTGKTLVGRILSTRKNLKHVDIYNAIENEKGKSIKEIILDEGIEKYRVYEKKILKNIEQGSVVSLSYDTLNDEENMIAVKKMGRVIYLRGRAETIYNILKEEKEERYFLKNDYSILSIESMIKEETKYYEEAANYIIDIDGKTINSIFEEALAIYNFANKVKCHIYIK